MTVEEALHELGKVQDKSARLTVRVHESAGEATLVAEILPEDEDGDLDFERMSSERDGEWEAPVVVESVRDWT